MFQSWLNDIWVHVLKHHLSQWEALQLVKDYISKHVHLEVEYYLGLTPKSKQSFQGLIDHLSLAFKSCETVSSLIGDNWSQKAQKTEDMFSDEMQVLVLKIVACKSEFLGEANQALKHQFRVVVRGQCLSSPDSESFTQFWG